MADSLSKRERSARMARVRAKDTKPEMVVRRTLHRLGYRYRLHAPELPGKPDIVFRPKRKAIFVHGCFWHMHDHPDCKKARVPKSRLNYWLPKLQRNREHDSRVRPELNAIDWQFLIVWECELRHLEQLENTLRDFLDGVRNQGID